MAMAMLLAGLSSCAINADDDTAVAASPLAADNPTPDGIALSCGQGPTSITYWASEWQLEILDADGVVGGCEFDASCLPTCWGQATDWTTWGGPLIQCPCR
jgi:hypothetical protein